MKKNTFALIDASKEVGPEINVEKTKYMLLSRHQNVGQNRDIKIAMRSFENVSKFKYLGRTLRNQNLIEEEIKRRRNSDNACYHPVHNLLLSKNVKIRIYKTIILLWFCMGAKARWRKQHNEELRDLYSSPTIIRKVKSRRMRRAGHVARMGEKKNAYRLLVGKPEGRRPLGRPRHR
jgi:hypothetical protein